MSIIDDAYRRFCQERFPLPTEEQVAELERRIGCTLPADYRQFILNYNGGYFREPEIEPTVDACPVDLLTYLHGIGAAHPEAELATKYQMSIFEENDPPEIVPIGETPMGSLILLIVHEDGYGEICFKEAFGDFYFLADGIEEFFSLLRERPEIETE